MNVAKAGTDPYYYSTDTGVENEGVAETPEGYAQAVSYGAGVGPVTLGTGAIGSAV